MTELISGSVDVGVRSSSLVAGRMIRLVVVGHTFVVLQDSAKTLPLNDSFMDLMSTKSLEIAGKRCVPKAFEDGNIYKPRLSP